MRVEVPDPVEVRMEQFELVNLSHFLQGRDTTYIYIPSQLLLQGSATMMLKKATVTLNPSDPNPPVGHAEV